MAQLRYNPKGRLCCDKGSVICRGKINTAAVDQFFNKISYRKIERKFIFNIEELKTVILEDLSSATGSPRTMIHSEFSIVNVV